LQQTTSNKKKVAVIGAGVSGLVATKWLAAEGHQVKTFEESGFIGGNWHYSPARNERHIKPTVNSDSMMMSSSSSCYLNMRTITHSSTMALEGSALPVRLPVFPHHSGIYRYLRKYCDDNKLWNYIHLNTKVLQVYPASRGYNVTYSSSSGGEVITEFFDAVAVCNGHNSQPYWPPDLVKDLSRFRGDVLHSRFYRSPNDYVGKKVLVLGGGISGKQIAFDVSSKARSVAISSRRPISLYDVYRGKPPLLARLTGSVVQLLPPLAPSPFSDNGVTFSDGTNKKFDVVIVCSGYENKFPFLDKRIQEAIIRSPPGSGHPTYLWLYKHTFPIPTSENQEVPTLAFIGMMDVVDASMFAVADAQAKWFSLLLSRKTLLPPHSQILAEMQKWKSKIDLSYHPMALSTKDNYPLLIHKLIEENKT